MRWLLVLALVGMLLPACGRVADSGAQPPTVAQTAAPATATNSTMRPSPTTVGADLPFDAPASCPVTRPPSPLFVPPSPPAPAIPLFGDFWYGSAALWTQLRHDGKWFGRPTARGIFNKSFWWREGYDARAEPQPDLTLTARRLDVAAPPVELAGATHALLPDGDAMLTGLTIPTWGCWSVTANYRATATVTFVVWVAADPR